MNVAVILFFAGLVAGTRAAPIDPMMDMGNLVITGLATWVFNGSGCVSSCAAKPGVCPGKDVTEANLRSCIECVVQCSSPNGAVKCFPDWGNQKIIDDLSGFFDALVLDGCGLGQASVGCTPMPDVLGEFFARLGTTAGKLPPPPPTGCPPGTSLPALPALTPAQKTNACANMKCTIEKASAMQACKRAVPVLPFVYTMMGQNMLGCPK